MTTTAFITHRDCLLHDMGTHHPECPQRLTAISDHLIAQGIDAYFNYHDAPLATFEQLLRVHPASHLERIKRASPTHGVVHLDPDTAMNPHTWQAALRAAGAGCQAVDLVMSAECENAFCAVRPPGHQQARKVVGDEVEIIPVANLAEALAALERIGGDAIEVPTTSTT